ncbi:MAG: hypothetical protein JJU37_14720 [Balneolaceae bacterium]|nr:hypothetical protein [Balneolaceae bacterium]
MAKFYLYKGDLPELLQLQSSSQGSSSQDSFCSHDFTTLADDWQESNDDNTPLIDMEYYPIPIQISASQSPAMLTYVFRDYFSIHQNLLSPFLKHTTPPPRLT